MNQILQVKGTSQENKMQNNSSNAKDIILFLIIVLVIFALLFGGYLIYKNIIKNDNNTIIPGNTIEPEKPEPTIILEQNERNELILNVDSEVELKSLTYSWNNENPQVIELQGKTNIEKIINIPIGDNTIYISVVDIYGEETKKQETFVVAEPRPEVKLSVIGSKIKIVVTSDIELSTIKYQWNSEQEKTENMKTYEDRKKFEKEIEIPIGENTLKIVAIDVNGNKAEKTQEIKGVTKATTTTKVEGEYWHFTVTGKENIKIVEFEFNGKKYVMNTTTFGETKRVHYKVKLVDGINKLNIKSITQSGGEDTTSWEKEYTKE